MYTQTQLPVLKFIKLDLQCYNLEKSFLILTEHTVVEVCDYSLRSQAFMLLTE